MPKRSPHLLTKKEVNERLKSAKDYISLNERVRIKHSSRVLLLPGYDPESVDACLHTKSVDDGLLSAFVKTFSQAQDRLTPEFLEETDPDPYTFSRKSSNARHIGSVIYIALYSATTSKIRTHACCWIGTWHHAPVLAWKPVPAVKIRVEKLPSYSDLM